jgi:hypothetical protein
MFGCVMKLGYCQPTVLRLLHSVTHNRSPVFKNLMTAMPSIMLAAELPKNLLLGFSVPSTLI